jgi:hypothetical protein
MHISGMKYMQRGTESAIKADCFFPIKTNDESDSLGL